MPNTGRNYERYDLSNSPLAQKPTQKELAALLHESKGDLVRLANYKEQFVVRREAVTGRKQKVRRLAYPTGRLRQVHERIKFLLNKVRQPEYLFSPRKGRSQRDNVASHLGSRQFLTLDVRQFYPSTTFTMIKSWMIESLGMYEDVAGLIAHLCTIDGVASFGSPVTPVLCSLVHREMFDNIHALCVDQSLVLSVWVDDITISGDFIPGELIGNIRAIIARHGLKSHDVRYRTGNRPVYVTGVGVVGNHLVAPNRMHLQIKEAWRSFYDAETFAERSTSRARLLSLLGTIRYIAGPKSSLGMKCANQMNSIRQKGSGSAFEPILTIGQRFMPGTDLASGDMLPF